MPRRAQRPSPLHGIAALSALVAGIVTLGVSMSHMTAPASVLEGKQVEIGVEHANPLTLSVAISTGKKQGLVEFSHEGTETVAVSIPSDWSEQEVRLRPLADVTADPPSFGFTRWHIPQSAHVRFLMPEEPSNILVHNPTHVPLQVRVRRVNLVTGATEDNVILITEKKATLW